MKNRNISASKQRLDVLFAYIRDLRTLNNSQLEAQWATYLCIRISGLLETSIRSIYVSYCDNKAHPNVTRYIGNSFEINRSQNMKPDTILSLAGSFSQEWRTDLEAYILDDGRKEAIESVINIRNSAAHGGTLSITYNNAKQYYEKIWSVIEFIDAQCP